jgi:cyclohexanecarboxylate-CoA ligase
MASPLAHQTGFMYGMMMAVMLGTTSVLQDIWDPGRAADIIAAERASFSMGATPFLADLCEIAETRRDDLASLRGFLCGGAPIPSPLVGRAVGAMDARILSGWGMTENGVVTMTAPDDPPQRAAETDGTTLPFMEVKLVDTAGAEVLRGAEGRLLVRTPSNFVGYLKRPRLYTVDEEGWFDSGDLARADATGAIRISGRVKDIVIRGGENIPVVEIEALLFKHPAVRAVAVVGMPDPRLGERLCAFVTPRDPGASLGLPNIVAFLDEQRVARQYMPERLVVLDEMPSTASGKIQKFRLRELARGLTAD